MALKYQISVNEKYQFSHFMELNGYQNIQTKSIVEAVRFKHKETGLTVILTTGKSDRFYTLPQNHADIYRRYKEWKFSRSQ